MYVILLATVSLALVPAEGREVLVLPEPGRVRPAVAPQYLVKTLLIWRVAHMHADDDDDDIHGH